MNGARWCHWLQGMQQGLTSASRTTIYRKLSYRVVVDIPLLYMPFSSCWTCKKSGIWTNTQTDKVQSETVFRLNLELTASTSITLSQPNARVTSRPRGHSFSSGSISSWPIAQGLKMLIQMLFPKPLNPLALTIAILSPNFSCSRQLRTLLLAMALPSGCFFHLNSGSRFFKNHLMSSLLAILAFTRALHFSPVLSGGHLCP